LEVGLLLLLLPLLVLLLTLTIPLPPIPPILPPLTPPTTLLTPLLRMDREVRAREEKEARGAGDCNGRVEAISRASEYTAWAATCDKRIVYDWKQWNT